MGQAPSQPGPPGTKFRVIGAGMCRTGTKTLNEALTILLNGPVHDAGVQSLGGSNHQIQQWLQIMKEAPHVKSFGQKKHVEYLLADVLEGYVATVDAPAAFLTDELLDVYPDAVVIVTTRDEESWWKSMQHVNGMMTSWYIPLLVMWVPKISVYRRWRELFGGVTVWRYGDEVINKSTLKKHEDHIRKVVPKGRLFFYEVKEGWEPLCKILNVPIPDRPFPHNNSKTDASKVYREVVTAGIVSWTFMICVVVIFMRLFWVNKAIEHNLPAASSS
ncbi:hypothetical protein GQ53DRAFT_789471 [Thozetella sp. PMI_491]|nr:hypothetical protein GQ53DRAFT_789471 [Thozetella sp. PMI_491]